MPDCFKTMGRTLTQGKMDKDFAKQSLKGSRLLQTRHGVIVPETTFANKNRVTTLWRSYLKKNRLAFVSKGNVPSLYPKKFLNTLNKADFVGLAEVKVPVKVVSKVSVKPPVSKVVKWDKKSYQRAFEKRVEAMTIDEYLLVQKWQNPPLYTHIRNFQRGLPVPANLLDEVKAFNKQWVKFMGKMPDYQGTLYRGLRGLSPEHMAKLQPGSVFEFKGFASSTTDRKIAEMFLKVDIGKVPAKATDVVFKIRTTTAKQLPGGAPKYKEFFITDRHKYKILRSTLVQAGDKSYTLIELVETKVPVPGVKKAAKKIIKVDVASKKIVTDVKIPARRSDALAKQYTSEEPISKKMNAAGGKNQSAVVEKKSGKYLEKTAKLNEVDIEKFYSDFADEMKSNIVPATTKVRPPGLSYDRVVQKWVDKPGYQVYQDAYYKAHKLGGAEAVAKFEKSLVDYIVTTKEGSDWTLMDHLFGQFDRHSANLMVNVTEGVVTEFRLIDNGMAFIRESSSRFLQSSAKRGFVLNRQTVSNFKSFLSKMGWAENAPNWNVVAENIGKHFNLTNQYKHLDYIQKDMIPRIKALMKADFKISTSIIDMTGAK